MDHPQVVPQRTRCTPSAETPQGTSLDRFHYLCPSRYFHFYLFFERMTHRTCWLPEGYSQ